MGVKEDLIVLMIIPLKFKYFLIVLCN